MADFQVIPNPQANGISLEDAREIAKKHGLEGEYDYCISKGMSPVEALAEWDLLDD